MIGGEGRGMVEGQRSQWEERTVDLFGEDKTGNKRIFMWIKVETGS